MCCHKEIEIKHKSEVIFQREALGDGAEPAELIPESEAIVAGFGSLAFPHLYLVPKYSGQENEASKYY